MPVTAERALKSVRSKKKSNFLTLPELLGVLTHWNRRVWSVAWSPDGKNIASGSKDKTVKVWNAQTGQCVSTLNGHSQSCTCTFDEGGYLEEAGPTCPLSGHSW